MLPSNLRRKFTIFKLGGVVGTTWYERISQIFLKTSKQKIYNETHVRNIRGIRITLCTSLQKFIFELFEKNNYF